MKGRKNYGIGQGRTAVDPLKRWNAKIKKDPASVCEVWQGKHTQYGRSTFFADRAQYDTRDYSWFLHYETWPTAPLERTCKTFGCVFWRHLREKTEKIRRVASTFDKDDVIEIRQRADRGEPIKLIAKEWPTASEQTVYLCARRKTYLWVTEDDLK